MNAKLIFTILSSIVGIACFLPYIRDIYKKKTEPHTYTWFIWTVLQITGVLAMYSSGAGIGIMSLAIGASFCLFVFILSFKYGTHNIKTFDVICLIGALIAIAFYFFLHNALLSVIVVALTDFIGFLPTFRKSFEEPHTETLSTYFLSATSSLLAIFALSVFNFTTAIYLISLVITNGLCALIIFIRRRTEFT